MKTSRLASQVQDTKDCARLLRFLSGKAVGFIAGGGGALGSAHLGVYKAFQEAGVEADILGGTSVGAAMTAGLAYGVDPDRVDQGTHNIFVTSRAFRRYRCLVTGFWITRISIERCKRNTATCR